MLDRTVAPALKPYRIQPFPAYSRTTLGNRHPVDGWFLDGDTWPGQEILFVFNTGLLHEPAPGMLQAALQLFLEGPTAYTSLEVSTFFDRLGASFSVDIGYEISTLTLSVLEQHTGPLLDFLVPLFTNPGLNEADFQLYVDRMYQKLTIAQTKTAWHARSLFLGALYGTEHPYGRRTEPAHIQALHRETLEAWLRTIVRPGNLYVVVAGAPASHACADRLGQFFDSLPQVPATTQQATRLAVPERPAPGTLLVHTMPQMIQASIRVGRRAISRLHPDFNRVRLVNTLFGGYFGSRLMKNIREDKGYTYGIYSQWVGYRDTGYWLISADVATEFIEPTLREIQLELERFLQAPVPEDELTRARNYLLGRMADSLETPYQTVDILKNRIALGLEPGEFTTALEQIQAATADEVLDLARTYYAPTDLIRVVSGNYTAAT
jgi:predicted Zn-dependent peptidase